MTRLRFVRRALWLAGTATTLVVGGCIHSFVHTVAVKILPDTGNVFVMTPLKVHLVDGRTVVFRNGATIDRHAIRGLGDAYPMLGSAADGTKTELVPLDSVVGVETFQSRVVGFPTLVASAAATAVSTAAVAFGAAALFVAIFGSCPTVYADTGSSAVLQAEGFSYAIAPLLEQRDLDPLRVRPDSNGVIRLELRNEALETHYINNLELMAVRHSRDERAVADQDGRPLLVSGIRPLVAAHDRAGRDVLSVLAASDGKLFSSTEESVNAAHIGDLDDWIDIDARDLAPGDSIAVVLRLRNSLLNTVLLYDGVLSGRDAPEWLDNGLQHISTAINLSTWYMRTMGMRASVDGVRPRSTDRPWNSRLGDVGPLAFRDVAIVLPRPRRDSKTAHIRLRFVADDWRIDYAGVADRVSRPKQAVVPLTRLILPAKVGETPVIDTAAMAALLEPDGRYLQTNPGQRMTLEFDVAKPVAHSDSSTTYLIAWQGWYREWIRGKWLAEPKRPPNWAPNDSLVLSALRRWHSRKAEMEEEFYSSRVPVR